MQLWKLTGKDDRGARVVFRDPMYGRSRLSRAERDAINGSGAYETIGKLIPPFIIVLNVLVGVQVAVQIFRHGWHPLFTALLVIAVPTTIIIIVMIPLIRCYLWDRFWQVRFKAIHRCPACECDLRGRAPESDGCSICPECSGAWRMPSASTVPPPLPQMAK